jgi:hypothetical protein
VQFFVTEFHLCTKRLAQSHLQIIIGHFDHHVNRKIFARSSGMRPGSMAFRVWMAGDKCGPGGNVAAGAGACEPDDRARPATADEIANFFGDDLEAVEAEERHTVGEQPPPGSEAWWRDLDAAFKPPPRPRPVTGNSVRVLIHTPWGRVRRLLLPASSTVGDIKDEIELSGKDGLVPAAIQCLQRCGAPCDDQATLSSLEAIPGRRFRLQLLLDLATTTRLELAERAELQEASAAKNAQPAALGPSQQGSSAPEAFAAPRPEPAAAGPTLGAETAESVRSWLGRAADSLTLLRGRVDSGLRRFFKRAAVPVAGRERDIHPCPAISRQVCRQYLEALTA